MNLKSKCICMLLYSFNTCQTLDEEKRILLFFCWIVILELIFDYHLALNEQNKKYDNYAFYSSSLLFSRKAIWCKLKLKR
jgi:hypothetical protein